MSDHLRNELQNVISGKSPVRFGAVIQAIAGHLGDGSEAGSRIEDSKQVREEEAASLASSVLVPSIVSLRHTNGMTRIFLVILLILCTGRVVAQTNDTIVFKPIFGCSCCRDTLSNPTDDRWVYVVSKSKNGINAYKNDKARWTIRSSDIWSNNSTINCVEFFEVNDHLVLRLYSDNEREYGQINAVSGVLVK